MVFLGRVWCCVPQISHGECLCFVGPGGITKGPEPGQGLYLFPPLWLLPAALSVGTATNSLGWQEGVLLSSASADPIVTGSTALRASVVLLPGALPKEHQGNLLWLVPGAKPQIHVAVCSAPKSPPLERFGLDFGIVLRRKVGEQLLDGH